ncbi:hypothetical protein JHK82_051158 [Glycine max]|nr:hypothetical protein JHK82_051158 [Glycine max]
MKDDALRLQFFPFLNDFENGRIPDSVELRSFHVEKLQIVDATSCRTKIEGLKEQIVNHEGDIKPTIYVLNGLVAMTRYYRFFLFGFKEDELGFESGSQKKPKTLSQILDLNSKMTLFYFMPQGKDDQTHISLVKFNIALLGKWRWRVGRAIRLCEGVYCHLNTVSWMGCM